MWQCEPSNPWSDERKNTNHIRLHNVMNRQIFEPSRLMNAETERRVHHRSHLLLPRASTEMRARGYDGEHDGDVGRWVWLLVHLRFIVSSFLSVCASPVSACWRSDLGPRPKRISPFTLPQCYCTPSDWALLSFVEPILNFFGLISLFLVTSWLSLVNVG